MTSATDSTASPMTPHEMKNGEPASENMKKHCEENESVPMKICALYAGDAGQQPAAMLPAPRRTQRAKAAAVVCRAAAM